LCRTYVLNLLVRCANCLPLCFPAPTSQVKPEELAGKVSSLLGDLKAANKEVEALRTQLTLAKSEVGATV